MSLYIRTIAVIEKMVNKTSYNGYSINFFNFLNFSFEKTCQVFFVM